MNLNLFKIYSYKFFDDFVLIYAFYAVMFSDFNVAPEKIGILLGVWSVVAFLLEVPSGVIADKYSRKHILFFAQLVRSAGYFVWILFPTFWGFLAGFILWGIKSAFASGTFEALLYDLLNSEGKSDKYAKILGTARGWSYAGNLCAAAVAAYAIQFGYTFVLSMSIVAIFISALSIILLPKAKPVQSTDENKYFTLLNHGLHTVRKNPALISIIIFLMFTYGLGGALDEYWPLFAENAGATLSGVAIFIGCMSAIQIVASLIAHKFEKISDRGLYGLFFVMGVILTTASYMFNISSLILLVLYSGISTVLITIYDAKLQHQAPEQVRATIGSIKGFFVEIMALAVYVVFGYLAGLLNYQNAFIVFGYVTIFVGLVFLIRQFFRGSQFVRA